MSRGDHTFARVPSVEMQRSSFDRSSGHKTTFDAGLLIPIFIDEALPGDTFNLQMTGFGRLATPIFPLMDNAWLESHWFFVPYRLLWENWERFNGAQDNPDDSTDFLIPRLDLAGNHYAAGELGDYMGLPPVDGLLVSALPFRAYNLIWREWFRDQNLQDSPAVPVDDGPDVPGTVPYILRRRGKRPDYFTTCLPFAQKGDAVSLPLGEFAPVYSDASAAFPPGGTGIPTFDAGGTISALAAGATGLNTPALFGNATIDPQVSWGDPHLGADLSAATAATINQLRQAFQIQRLLERDARGGTRYTEIVRAHFGVVSPDARLQRPEYLGGGSSPLIISQVPQTSESSATSPQGNLSAYGTVTARNHGFVQSFTEHGIVMGLVSVRAEQTYQQGIERFWSRQTRFDFYWPALSHLGEQAVLNQEIYAQGEAAAAVDAATFGFQERYGEYRYKPSRLSGLMRSAAPGSLDPWHLAVDYAALPVLDDQFIQEDPPFDRVIAVNTEPHFIFDAHIALRCARPMPLYGVPGLIDHF